MKKVAIVGVEGSGKTVMLAVLGALYSQVDENGYFLEPQDRDTLAYVRRVCGILQSGKWPGATETDCAFGLKWHLRKQTGKAGKSKVVCEVSCLDFAGEVYRSAFSGNQNRGLGTQIRELKEYLRGADTIVLLLNLRDSITRGLGDRRAVDAEYSALAMLKFVLEPADAVQRLPRVLLALSQADAYAATLDACGGPKDTLKKYLPLIASHFGYLDVVAVNSCGTTTDGNGHCVPDRNLSLAGLKPMLDWILHAPTDWRNIPRACAGVGRSAMRAVASAPYRRICTSPWTLGGLSLLFVAALLFGAVTWTYHLDGFLQSVLVYLAYGCGGIPAGSVLLTAYGEREQGGIHWAILGCGLIAVLPFCLLFHFLAWAFS